jgi:hypothetical protein
MSKPKVGSGTEAVAPDYGAGSKHQNIKPDTHFAMVIEL